MNYVLSQHFVVYRKIKEMIKLFTSETQRVSINKKKGFIVITIMNSVF